MIVVLVLLPILYIYAMYRKFDDLWLPSVKDKIGTIYSNMNSEKV